MTEAANGKRFKLGAAGWVNRLAGYRDAGFAALLLLVLVVISVWLTPSRFGLDSLGTTIGLAAPLVLAAMASTPVILAGHGGIDLSVGPLMGLLNVIIVRFLLTIPLLSSPVAIVVVVMALGLLSGILNGFLTASLRLQPIVATLGTYLIYSGVALWIAPTPGGSIPGWLSGLAGTASLVPILAAAALWWLLTRSPYYEHLMATGGDDRAAYSSGVPVVQVRIGAYMVTGLFAAIGALSLTALLGSEDPTVGPTYTLIAIAGVALGGVSLAGGRGGMFAAIIGAADIFLIQIVLTFFSVSTFALQVTYGVVLVGAVVLNASVARGLTRRQWSRE